MKNGKCPRCNSNQVFKKKANNYRAYLAISLFNATRLMDYACVECGYIESYVDERNKLESIEKRWERVTSSGV
jgi:DNA-directed RNA polymerase subunit RPC12/RpoP